MHKIQMRHLHSLALKTRQQFEIICPPPVSGGSQPSSPEHSLKAQDDYNAGCDTHIHTVVIESAAGIDLFKLKSSTYWCWDGSQITVDRNFTVHDSIHAPLWEYVGVQFKSESGGKGEWSHSDYVQGHFKFCVLGVCNHSILPSPSNRTETGILQARQKPDSVFDRPESLRRSKRCFGPTCSP